MQVALFRQLASALNAIHSSGLSTQALCPLSVASVWLDSVDSPATIRIAPYAREVSALRMDGGATPAAVLQELCIPPEAWTAGGAADAAVADPAAADVWRAAVVAVAALGGRDLLHAVRRGAQSAPFLLRAVLCKLRKDPARMPGELADIFEVRCRACAACAGPRAELRPSHAFTCSFCCVAGFVSFREGIRIKSGAKQLV